MVGQRIFGIVPDDIVNPQLLFGFAPPGQFDHLLGQIHAGDFCRAALADHPSIETFAAGDVDRSGGCASLVERADIALLSLAPAAVLPPVTPAIPEAVARFRLRPLERLNFSALWPVPAGRFGWTARGNAPCVMEIVSWLTAGTIDTAWPGVSPAIAEFVQGAQGRDGRRGQAEAAGARAGLDRLRREGRSARN